MLSFPLNVRLKKPVTEAKIRQTLFSLSGTKAPDPDFKYSWQIVGEEVVKVMFSLFNSSRLLGEVNATILISLKFLTLSTLAILGQYIVVILFKSV
jgi:hypothetical protein